MIGTVQIAALAGIAVLAVAGGAMFWWLTSPSQANALWSEHGTSRKASERPKAEDAASV